MKKVLVIILFLFSLNPAISSENQKTELNKLFSELKKINNSSEAKIIENKNMEVVDNFTHQNRA